MGKSLLAGKLAKKLKTSLVPTDSLRQGVIEFNSVSKDSDLFSVIEKGEWEDPKNYYSKYSAKEAISFQNQESSEVAKLVRGFVESIDYQGLDKYIFEGVALMPQFFSKEFLKKYGIKFFCVGNTNFEQFLKYSWKNRTAGDWLEKEDFETFKRVIAYCTEFSKWVRKDCKKNNIKYFEVDSANFKKSIAQISSWISRAI